MKLITNRNEIIKHLQYPQKTKLFTNHSHKRTITEATQSSKKLFLDYDYITTIHSKNYNDLHSMNSQFLKTYNNFSTKSKQQNYLEKTFIDLIIKYKCKGYKIPNLTTEHSLFSPSVLLMENNEMEEFYKYSINSKRKDKSKIYLSKIGKYVDALIAKKVMNTDRDRITKPNDNEKENKINEDNFYSMTERKRPNRHVIKMKNEKRQLKNGIDITLKSIKEIEGSINMKTLLSSRVVIPKKRILSKEDQTMNPIKTLSSFVSTIYTNKDNSQSPSIYRNNSNRIDNTFQTKVFKDKVTEKDLNIHSLSRNKVNKVFDISHHNLTTKEEYLSFFFSLKLDDINRYNFEEIAKNYCLKFFTKSEQENFDNLYSKK